MTRQRPSSTTMSGGTSMIVGSGTLGTDDAGTAVESGSVGTAAAGNGIAPRSNPRSRPWIRIVAAERRPPFALLLVREAVF